jgi:preprotein translocase subunit SecB
MTSSLLELERYFFTKVHIDAIPGSSSQSPTLLKATVELRQKKDDKRRFLVQVDVAIGASPNEHSHYRGDVSVVGYFKVDPRYREDPAKLAGITGASILYNAIREMLANITARGPWPTFTLPCFSFKAADASEASKSSKRERTREVSKRYRRKQAILSR